MYDPYEYYPVYRHSPGNTSINHSIPHRSQYSPVDITLFSGSLHTFQTLMEQGSILLDRLRVPAFANKLMELAQQGKQREVDQLIQTIGLKVSVKAKYTPSEVIFILKPQPLANVPECCTLTFAIRWGN
jgi:hypothetical protein